MINDDRTRKPLVAVCSLCNFQPEREAKEPDKLFQKLLGSCATIPKDCPTSTSTHAKKGNIRTTGQTLALTSRTSKQVENSESCRELSDVGPHRERLHGVQPSRVSVANRRLISTVRDDTKF